MPRDIGRPFTRAEALAGGLSRRRLYGPRYRALFPGVFVDAGVAETPELRARASLLVVPEAVAVAHLSAAALLGLPCPTADEAHVLLPPGAPRVRRVGIRTHVGARRLTEVKGVRATSAIDSFVDVACDVPLVDAVVLADAIVHQGRAGLAQLRDATERFSGPGADRARRAARLARRRVESPQETRLRLLMVLSGLPEPQTGFPLEVEGRRRRLDTAYVEPLVGVEYDGLHHLQQPGQFGRDMERREQLDRAGWHLVTVTADAMWDPAAVIARVRTALADRGMTLPPIDPRWQRHFPVRRGLTS